MKIFFDSSSFAKLYLRELGSDEADAVCWSATELAVSVLCVPEVVSALSRRLRDNGLSHEEYSDMKRDLLADVRDATILDLTPEVISRSMPLLESNELRASDALHVACALEWGADLFVSSDRRQVRAAKKCGLPTRQI